MQYRIILVALAVVLAGTVPAQAGDIYKTVDQNGNVIYSDTPPRDGNAERLETETRPTDLSQVAAVNENLRASREALNDRQAEAQDQATRQADVAEQRAANCEVAKRRLDSAETAHRMYRETEDGEREYYSADEQDAYKAKAQADVAEWCN